MTPRAHAERLPLLFADLVGSAQLTSGQADQLWVHHVTVTRGAPAVHGDLEVHDDGRRLHGCPDGAGDALGRAVTMFRSRLWSKFSGLLCTPFPVGVRK